MADLVDADEAVGELKHVVAERDDDKLGVLGALLDVVGYDGDLCSKCRRTGMPECEKSAKGLV